MAKFNDKISTILNAQLPEFVVEQHPKFAEFLKIYYQLLESAELSVTSIQTTDGIDIENETGAEGNIVLNSSEIGTQRTLLNEGDKILLEDSVFGKFQFGETITGQISNATATIICEDLQNGKLQISSQDKFIINEEIRGSLSNASAVINNYRPSPVNNIMDLTNFRDPDNVVSSFLNNFRDEFLATLPENLASGVDKRKLIKNIKSLYRAKGTNRGHETFFRLLFNEISETIYPREQILRVSDGDFDSRTVLRALNAEGDVGGLTGRLITGVTSGATAIVENVRRFQIGEFTVNEFTLNRDTIVGNFTIGEVIRGTQNDGDFNFIKATVTGIPRTKTILNDGSLYTTNDLISLSGGGQGALLSISATGRGKVEEIVIDNPGTGYSVGDVLVFDNTGTGGQAARAFVSVINGGFTPESGTLGTDSEDHIVLEDFTGDGDKYFGNKIVQEAFVDDGVGGADPQDDSITDVFIINGGINYQILPKVTVTSSGGSGAILKTFGSQIGRVIGVSTVEFGIRHELSPSPPTLGFFNNLIITNVSGSFPVNGTVTGNSSSTTGTIVSFDSDRGLLKLKDVSGSFTLNEGLTTSASGTAILSKNDPANVSVNVDSISETEGRFINDDGKISETVMRIQDSLYYQDFSYVLKVGESINSWRDAFKKTMHTAGFYFTGLVTIESRLNVKTKSPVIGEVSGAIDTGLFSIVNTLFQTIFGRRLGTVDDSVQRVNAQVGVVGDFYNDTRFAFPKQLDSSSTLQRTRDVTLFRPGLRLDILSRMRRTIDNVNVAQGFVYAGPRYRSLNRFANTAFGTSNTGSAITFETLDNLRVFGTNSTLDGRKPIFLMTSDPGGQYVKMAFAFPSITFESQNSFDNIVVTFDNTNPTFDDTTP